MFGVGEHGDKDIGVLGDLFYLFAEGDAVLAGFLLFVGVDVKGEDLVSSFGEVDGHGETHIAKSHETDLSESKDVLDCQLHKILYDNKLDSCSI
jgi:hypothetical protein